MKNFRGFLKFRRSLFYINEPTNEAMKTITAVRRSFWDAHPQFKSEFRKTWSQNQYKLDIRLHFIDYVEFLRRDGEITEKLASRVTL